MLSFITTPSPTRLEARSTFVNKKMVDDTAGAAFSKRRCIPCEPGVLDRCRQQHPKNVGVNDIDVRESRPGHRGAQRWYPYRDEARRIGSVKHLSVWRGAPHRHHSGGARRLARAGVLCAVRLRQLDLAQTHGVRRDFDALVVAHHLERFVEGQRAVHVQPHKLFRR